MTKTPLDDISGGVCLFIRLQPGASSNKFDGLMEDASGKVWLKARVTAVPEKGKANKALLKLLSKSFKIAASHMKIIAGETDRNKTILIAPEADRALMMKEVQMFANIAK
ncbi:DUF167 domain-containing protein [Sneathiella sp. P13V-1]|uniref:DUF167 domain-containing protein n=1 Tax=Sneathiella sp. P13V-1 TaxID=2697366 RepID=UPI00187B118B|nr:DUF167 domain-containing protein [Sneathiella sp. P13V-1]MBE7636418.1 DUF167 domain-containing protein [Sneathiella sp. P13V-1]